MNVHPVSVIIPTYNRKHFLPRAINSVFVQTHGCGEIIVVDDGSTDGTEEYISSLRPRGEISIRFFRQKNGGPAAARNRGIAHARYEYITFLDSDDHWHKRKIEKQFGQIAMDPSCLISCTREKWLRQGLHHNQKKRHLVEQENIFGQCLGLCVIGMSTVMVRKELFSLVGTFDESFRCCEDYEFWLRVSCRFPFLLVDEVLTVKEGGRSDQVSHQYKVGMDKLHIRAIEKLLSERHLDRQQRRMAMRELVKKATIYGNGCIRHGRTMEGRGYLEKAASVQRLLEENVQ